MFVSCAELEDVHVHSDAEARVGPSRGQHSFKFPFQTLYPSSKRPHASLSSGWGQGAQAAAGAGAAALLAPSQGMLRGDPGYPVWDVCFPGSPSQAQASKDQDAQPHSGCYHIVTPL
eukprot:4593-Rhodomonas_salina.1